MESKELLYTAYRLQELESLLPEGLSATELQRVGVLVEQRDDVGLIAFLERLNLSPENRGRLQIIVEARPIALKIVELWREMPLRHEEIEAHYKQLQHLKVQYDRLTPRRAGAELF
ncbi:MAG: hypothetical protein ACE5MG_10740 [Candidatus Methylomirabilales bacterium]